MKHKHKPIIIVHIYGQLVCIPKEMQLRLAKLNLKVIKKWNNTIL